MINVVCGDVELLVAMNAFEVVFVIFTHVLHSIVEFIETFWTELAEEWLGRCVASFNVLLQVVLRDSRIWSAGFATDTIASCLDVSSNEFFEGQPSSFGIDRTLNDCCSSPFFNWTAIENLFWKEMS